MQTLVISLGGSLVVPEAVKVDILFLKRFRRLILKYTRRENRFAIIVGGGKLCRVWQSAARGLGIKAARELDWIGIKTTCVNAELVRALFGNSAYGEVVANPERRVAKFKILVGAGFKPGHSTDYDAVVRAKTLGAKIVVNLSDVEYVYSKDPLKYKDAKPLKRISWRDFFKIAGAKGFTPGMHTPFDPTAAKFAALNGLTVVFISGKDIKNFERFLQRKEFRGTIISN